MWYGGSSIAARFLNYLMTPFLTNKLVVSSYGQMSLVYSAIPFLNVLFTYGLETAYFRFIQRKDREKAVYDTASVSLLISTISLTALLLLFRNVFARITSVGEHPEFITWTILIIGFDALATLAFAKLRHDNRPIKFAAIRITGIIVNIALTVFFLSVCPYMAKTHPDSFWIILYDKDMGVGYVILANLVQSVLTFLLLAREFFSFRWRFDAALWREMMLYSMPMLIVGFGGVINETMDRLMLSWWSTEPTKEAREAQVGIYAACYKLSLLVTLFVQAFRMGAEPFFFKQANNDNPEKTYARVMKFFVMTICLMFLVVALFLDIWKYFIQNEQMREGLSVVPILLLANMFLGIYYNLSVWYKIRNKTLSGAAITLIGAAITVGINYVFIPRYGYQACAWATFFCYGAMMVISYIWGQRVYPIPYASKKLLAYIVIVIALYFVKIGISRLFPSAIFGYGVSLVLLLLFTLFLIRVEKREFRRLPYIGRYFS